MKDWKPLLARAVVFLVAVTLALGLYEMVIKPIAAGAPTRDGLYGVFLTNGQVYFGAIERETGDRVVLVNVFYPKTRPEAVTDPTKQDDLQLIKLGSELYAPEDRIEISSDQVLYLAKLKEDGKVGKAMREYKK